MRSRGLVLLQAMAAVVDSTLRVGDSNSTVVLLPKGLRFDRRDPCAIGRTQVVDVSQVELKRSCMVRSHR